MFWRLCDDFRIMVLSNSAMKIAANTQNLIYKIRAASIIGQKRHFFFLKKGTKNFNTPCSIPFQRVLNESKALHNFHKWGRRPIDRHIEGLD